MILIMTSKFKIINLKMIGQHEYTSPIGNDTCNICKFNINGFSIFNKKNIIYDIIEGKCGHSYHADCLEKISMINCPTCCQPWIIEKKIKN